MTSEYYLLMSQYQARETAFGLLALYGVGAALLGLLLHKFSRTPGWHGRLASALLWVHIGGNLLLWAAGLVILPLVQSNLF